MSSDLILVGVFGAPHGVRGEVRLKANTQDPAAVGDYGPVQAEDGRRFDLEVLRVLKDDMVVVRVDGVADRDAAASLTHLKLFVPRDRLPAPEEDEFYASDLVGLAVVDRAGAILGRIKAVVDFGAGDLLDVERGEGAASVLLPFTRAFVPEVDLPARRVVAEPPAGLFDDEGAEASPAEEQDTGPPLRPVEPPPAPAGPPGRRKGGRW